MSGNLKKLKLLEAQLKVQKELPHIYGTKLYRWQRDFLNSTNRLNLLTAANQIGKSSINIVKVITWATSKDLWKKLWPKKIFNSNDCPSQFWYLYPDLKLATVEFKEKWVREFLPRGSMKDHPEYGWEAVFERRCISELRFNSGVTIYFKTYMQNPQSLQAGTVYAIFCDEELPFNLYDEIKFRLSGTDGYFHLVFTATLNQDEWRQAMEPVKNEKEKFPKAFKRQVSLYDCMEYEDGSETVWTKERIQERVEDCGSETEMKRRIYGKFVSEMGRKYNFEYDRDIIKPRALENEWYVYSGVDIGSGGATGHPAAIVFCMVSPDFTQGEIFCGKRMDGVLTTAGDILEEYIKMREPFRKRVVKQCYDYQARDFFTLATRINENFTPANKKHTDGENIINTLLRFGALKIHKEAYDLYKLCHELNNLQQVYDKRKPKYKDDYSDALRYCVTAIPWNMEQIKIKRGKKPRKQKTQLELRREMFVDPADGWLDKDEYDNEISFWNDLYEA